MKKLTLILLIIATLFSCECECQVPSVGGMMKPFITESSGSWCDIDMLSYDNVSIDITTTVNDIMAITFKPDGTKMYIGAGGSTLGVQQYSLSIPWDVTTASYEKTNTTMYNSSVTHIEFNDDGTEMIITGSSKIWLLNYELSIPWDIGNISQITGSNLATYAAQSITFNPTGSRRYILLSNKNIRQYDLTIPFNITETAYTNVYLPTTLNYCHSLQFNEEGTRMYIASSNDGANSEVQQYSLSIPWDVTTATYENVKYIFSDDHLGIITSYINPDGTNIYIGAHTSTSNIIYQYTVCGN